MERKYKKIMVILLILLSPYGLNRSFLDQASGELIEEDFNYEEHPAYIEGYGDNSIRPEEMATREELSIIIFRLLDPEFRSEILSEENDFKDISGDRWSNRAISSLSRANILRGYPDKQFKAQRKVTRAEAASIVSRVISLNKAKEGSFNDIEGHWAEECISALKAEDYIEGYEDGSFKPDNPITRAELVSILNKTLNRGISKDNIPEGIKEFSDLDQDKWYYEDMVEASNHHDFNRKKFDDEVWINFLDSRKLSGY